MTVRGGSFRRVLAEATGPDHIKLHSHPWIASLDGPGLTEDRYQLILGAYQAFFSSAESVRHEKGVFANLSLAEPISALNRDLLKAPRRMHGELRLPLACTATPAAVLGLLYVLHGSGFGARVLAANVRKTLPEVPCHYLSAGTPTALWRVLVAELEGLRAGEAGQQAAIESACCAFIAFGRFVTSYCEGSTIVAFPSQRVAPADVGSLRIHG